VDGAHSAAASDLTDTLDVANMASSGDYHQGDVITIAGHSQQYTVLADVTASSGSATLNIAPGLQVGLSGGEGITLVASHTVNLGFTREAFAFVTAPFERDAVPGNEVATMQDPKTGLVLRLEICRQYKQTMWEFDLLWGSACVRPQFAVRLAG
jgi:hypothetical protein